jgi:hypothetical protein
MANSKDILSSLIKEDLIQAKNLINEALLEKLGNALEQKLIDFAPTVFAESQASHGGLKGNQKKLDKNKNGKLDKEDFKMLRKEDIEFLDDSITEEDLALAEAFQNEIALLVQEIQEESGQQLSEEEIEQLANEYLDILSEEKEEDEDEEDSEDDEDEKDHSKKHKKKED